MNTSFPEPHPPTPRRTRVRTAATWVGGFAFGVAAWGVLALLPPTSDQYNPFIIGGTIGEPIESRDLRVTVLDGAVSAGAHGTNSTPDAQLDGTWAVFDIEAEPLLTDNARLTYVRLVIDGVSYPATDRFVTMSRDFLRLDFSRTGSVAFQIPDSVTSGDAHLEFGYSYRGAIDPPVLDDIIRYTIDLGELPRVVDREILSPQWSTR